MKIYKTDSAFEASLSFGFKEHKNQFDILKEDFAISKYAGVNIYQPTIDNIENFIHKYTLSELANVGVPTVVHVNLNPLSYNVEKSEYVNEGQGVATVKVKDATLELPFMIMDGEFIPFDIIKLDKQRVPYSRENIKKIIHGIVNHKKCDSPVEEFKPFLGTEKAVNTTSSIGFLGDILRIQDEHTGRGSSPGNSYVTSAGTIDDSMEKIGRALDKIAKMQVTTDKEWNKLESMVREAVTKKEIEKMAKEAEELKDEGNDTVNLFTRVKDINFENASKMPNGACIAFPQVCDEKKEISMNQGVVISDYLDVDGVNLKNVKVLVTKDNQMKILKNNEKFLCKRIEGDGLRLPSIGIGSLKDGDIFVSFDGNKAFYPCKVSHQTIRKFMAKNDSLEEVSSSFDNSYTVPQSDGSSVKILTLKPIIYDNSGEVFGDMVDDDYKTIRVVLVEGQSFNEMSYNEFVELMSKKLGVNDLEVTRLIGKGSVANKDKVICVDPETKVVPVTGVIKGYLKNPEDIHDMVGSTEGEFELFKSAAQINNVEIRQADKFRDTYNVKVNYMDKSKKMFKAIHKDYHNLAVNELRGVLKVLNFDIPKISEIIGRAKNETFVTYELPQGAQPERLEGAQIGTMATDVMKKVKDTVYSKDVVDGLAADVLGALIAGAALTGGVGMDIYNTVGKFAKETEALSTVFEKIAIEKKSPSMRKVAAIMALATHFNEKLADISSGKKQYAKLNEVVADIVDMRDSLEKTASQLIELKYAQYKNRDFIVNPGYIGEAVRHMDNMFKLASGLNRR